jgi:hypothetical protein
MNRIRRESLVCAIRFLTIVNQNVRRYSCSKYSQAHSAEFGAIGHGLRPCPRSDLRRMESNRRCSGNAHRFHAHDEGGRRQSNGRDLNSRGSWTAQKLSLALNTPKGY